MSQAGPYTRLGRGGAQMAQQAQEDPFLFRNPRGEWHMLTHTMQRGSSVGLHSYSMDGASWTLGTPSAAYSKSVQWADGTNTTFAERERPVLLFDASGHPTHLINGVREAPAESQPEPKQRAHVRARSGSFPNQPTYTIVIPIKS